MERESWPRRIIRILFAVLLVFLIVTAVIWRVTLPHPPDAFYSMSGDLPKSPGRLLRVETYTNRVPPAYNGWRILYSTTRFDGSVTLASAIVIAPKIQEHSANVIAWMHGTTGATPGCAPSIRIPFRSFPAFDQAIAEGWIIVATDYVGLGTAGPHPYLIGAGEADSALDSLRALHQMKGLNIGNQAVIWGHSQGGHAAIWTGILAPRYAPEQKIVGVAASAPTTDLVELFRTAQFTPIGKIVSAFAITSYSAIYSDVNLDAYVRRQWLTRDMADRCLGRTELLFLRGESVLLGKSIFARDPASGALGNHLRENTPNGTMQMPLLLAQGKSDDLVLPEMQDSFVQKQCSEGNTIEYIQYSGRDHFTLAAKDSPYNPDLIQWTRDRFAGKSSQASCQTIEK